MGSRVRERSHGPPELPSRRVGSSSCRRSRKRAEVRAKDCFRGGAPFGARRHVPLPGRVCPVLPPTMSARCAMTCPSMRTPLGEPDCVFLWSTGRRSQRRTDVPSLRPRGSASDRAVQTGRAQRRSANIRGRRDLGGRRLQIASLLELIGDSRAHDIDGLTSPMLGHRNGAREVCDRGRSAANLAEIVVEIFDPADPVRSKWHPFGAGAKQHHRTCRSAPSGRRFGNRQRRQRFLSTCAPSVPRRARRWRRALRCRPATSQGGCAPWPDI